MQPIDQMSTSTEYLVGPRRSSGARYQRLMTYCVIIPSISALLASPKSQILRTPPLEYRRLDGLRSLWTIFLACRNSMPSNKSLTSLLTCCWLNWTDLRSSFISCSMYSMTIKTRFLSLFPEILLILIMFSCLRVFRMAIYLREVMGKLPEWSYGEIVALNQLEFLDGDNFLSDLVLCPVNYSISSLMNSIQSEIVIDINAAFSESTPNPGLWINIIMVLLFWLFVQHYYILIFTTSSLTASFLYLKISIYYDCLCFIGYFMFIFVWLYILL